VCGGDARVAGPPLPCSVARAPFRQCSSACLVSACLSVCLSVLSVCLSACLLVSPVRYILYAIQGAAACVRTCMHACMRVCVCACVCACVCMCGKHVDRHVVVKFVGLFALQHGSGVWCRVLQEGFRVYCTLLHIARPSDRYPSYLVISRHISSHIYMHLYMFNIHMYIYISICTACRRPSHRCGWVRGCLLGTPVTGLLLPLVPLQEMGAGINS